MRRCYRCGVERPPEMFYLDAEARRSAKTGRKAVLLCRVCSREVAVERQRPRRTILEAAKAAGCVDCGLVEPNHPEVFDLDHRPDTEKLHNIADLMTKGTLDDLRAELAKCDVVCANCHRKRTKARDSGRFGIPHRRYR